MRKITKLLFTVLCIFGSLSVQAQDKKIAFPGAEGFGRYTTGGRGGNVYHVTTLEDNGKTSLVGSLRWANAQAGPRTIVFDVCGTIMLKSDLRIKSNTTLAGQTAPGDGICIANYPLTLEDNIIVRYMRFRLGNQAIQEAVEKWATNNGYTKAQVFANSDLLKKVTMPHEGDGLGAMDRKNIIVDHCSVSWSIDECLSVYGSKDITVQWCISSQSLVNAGHSKGNHGYGGNWGGSGASYHHNLMIHHTSRTPRLGPRPGTQTDERMDLRNNVIYNWGGNGCYGGEGMNVNIVNNYYKPGPATMKSSTGIQQRIAGIGIRTTSYTGHDTATPNQWDVMWHVWGKFFVNGNVNPVHDVVTQDNWAYGIYNQVRQQDVDNTFNDDVKVSMRLQEPINFVATTTHTAEKAYEQVLKYVGASLHRDALDEILINDALDGKATFTGSGNNPGFINSQEDVKSIIPTLWPELKQEEAKPDTDGDGMPDEWEQNKGLNPNDKSDGNTYTLDKDYTNLEVYLNSIVEHITNAQIEGGAMMGEGLPGESIPVSYTLDANTYMESSDVLWTFKDNISITPSSKSTYYGSNYMFDSFRIESNKQYTINLPEGVTISGITFSGYCNGTGTQTSYLNELNGTTYESSQYKFPNRSKQEAATYTIPLAAKNKITFTAKGQNATCITINLTGTKSDMTTSINTVQTHHRSMNDNCIYTLQGMRVQHLQKGIYIQNGKKIIIK